MPPVDAPVPDPRCVPEPAPAAHPPASVPVVLRDCTATDIPAITRIYGHAVRHGSASFEIDPPDDSEMARRRQALLDAGYPYLVAERQGQVLGYAYASAYRARPAYGATVENSVYVDEAAQGQGVGRLLMQALITRCAAGGWRQMVAVIGDSANTGSRRLHEATGFRLVGVLQSIGFKHGRWLDTVLMQRELGPGDTQPRGAREAWPPL